ncbi:MAG: bifunctional diaminohydroxyphosphoribosylaminopyrimidine deaminase/5-amino-6-(5-phosphoribosylamino)uracil reductase RibD [Candidatus Eisenbacteria sp.]|nr:bifunctional diaminohydroxyphosphoribosylaminopyrimidine deaminase/5-amino-6-(5-phosphoribosylamino)uracil reductase RibD [Candidatus Eisenbacteria bacterium]
MERGAGGSGQGGSQFALEQRWMRLALRLARLGCGRTHPNPRVGAVAVRDGEIVARGVHLHFGGPHAEAALIAGAPAGSLTGATLIINLEPCSHKGKTPPCAPAIVRAGFRRVVAAIEDPNPQVAGSGFACLRAAGLQVESGLLARAARTLNAPFLWHQATGRALLTAKIASSLDGRLAAGDGSSRWITGPHARERVARWRAECDALLIGRGTLLTDRPRLTARPRRDPLRALRRELPQAAAAWPHQPVRIVVDSRCRVAAEGVGDSLTVSPTGGPWVVACGARAPQARIRALEERGIRCWRLPEAGGGAGVDLHALARRCAAEGLLDVVVEGGATLTTALFRAGLVGRLRLFLAGILLGGARSWCGDLGVTTLTGRLGLTITRQERVGPDILIHALSPQAARLLGEEEPALPELELRGEGSRRGGT